MKTICSLILLLLFAPVAHAADTISSFNATLTLTFTSQPKLTLTGMLDNSLGGRWDNRTQTLRIYDRFGVGTEKFLLPDARVLLGGKWNLPKNNTVSAVIGQRNNDATLKPKDQFGNAIGRGEPVYVIGWHWSF